MAQETTDQVNRQPTDWEKGFTNYTLDKGLIPKTYKEFKLLNDDKNNHTF